MFPKLNVLSKAESLHERMLQIVWNLTQIMQAFVRRHGYNKREGSKMKKYIALAVAFAAIAIVAGPEASAQSFSFNNGYQFGAGARASGAHGHHRGFQNPGFGFGTVFGRGFSRQARPPYFAEFPPVYYNGIVRRPYGISPYAAPAGVTPVEMTVKAVSIDPMTISNPFFNKNGNPPIPVVETGEEELKTTTNKSTKTTNPYFENVPENSGNTMHASFETLE